MMTYRSLHVSRILLICLLFSIALNYLKIQRIVFANYSGLLHHDSKFDAEPGNNLVVQRVTDKNYSRNELMNLDGDMDVDYVSTISFPQDLLQIMTTACTHDPCKLIATEHNNPIRLERALIDFGETRDLEQKGKFAGWKTSEVLDLEHAFVSPEGDVVKCSTNVSEPRSTIVGSFGCKDDLPFSSDVCTNDQLPFIPSVSERLIVISQFWGYGYFHFFIEGLPRLVSAFDYLIIRGESNHHDWDVHSMIAEPLATQAAEFMGVRKFVSGDVMGARLLVPTSTPCGGNLVKRKNHKLRSFIWNRVRQLNSASDVRQGQNVFVLIKRTGGRSLQNHQEIMTECQRLWKGVVIEHLSDLPFSKQLDLFHSASAVLGPHGAGLSNCLAMKRGTTMIEVMPEIGPGLNMCYATLAFTLDLQYFALRAPGFDSGSVGMLPLSNLRQLPIWG
jgi:hypothetical protein